MQSSHIQVTQELNHPIASVWTRPRQTIRFATDRGDWWPILVLAAFSGVAEFLDPPPLTLPTSVTWSLPMIIAVGALLGVVRLFVLATVCLWVGRWQGGLATFRQLAAALGWSAVPIAFGLPVLLILHTADSWGDSGFAIAPYVLLRLLHAVLATWSLVLLFVMVAEVQGFPSIWKGFVNVWISLMVILAPLSLAARWFGWP